MSASGIGGAFYRVFVQTTFNIAGAGAGQDISGNLQILGFFIFRAIFNVIVAVGSRDDKIGAGAAG